MRRGPCGVNWCDARSACNECSTGESILRESDDVPEPLEITAYTVSAGAPDLRPGSRQRQWMDDTPGRFAYRCLPLVIANQHGWDVLSPASFAARWRGGVGQDEIELVFAGDPDSHVSTHFGSGIVRSEERR